MTRDELRNALLDDMNIDYYSSNLCQMIDNIQMTDGISLGRGSMEEAVFELLDDLSHSVMETMEENGVLKEKKAIPS